MKKVFSSVKSTMKGGEQMKRILVLALVFAFLTAGLAVASVINTPHDLRGSSAVNNSQEVCAACHTPHHSQDNTNGPLWNRSQGAQTYTFYSSATFDVTTGTLSLGPQSLACMTCHNGQTSTLVNAPGPGLGGGVSWDPSAAFSRGGNIGLDLSNDHPVGFAYDPGLDKQGNGFPAVVGGKIAGVYPVYGTSNKIECATCHDVHDTATYTGKNTTAVYFLRATNDGSAMCKACHVNR